MIRETQAVVKSGGNITKEILLRYLASQCGLKQKISSPFKLLLSLPAIISLLADSFSPAPPAAEGNGPRAKKRNLCGRLLPPDS